MSEKWYLVYDNNGNSVSIGTIIANPLPENLYAIELSENESDAYRSGHATWDSSTLSIRFNPAQIPTTISARQIRLWLIQHGFQLSQIESAIDSIENPLVRETIRIEWEYAPYIERNHPWLVTLAKSLGLNETQIDQAFIEASVI